MLNPTVRDAIYDQINLEFTSFYSYLGMAAYCEHQNFLGCANWLRLQAEEEKQHAMRLYSFLLARNCPVKLKEIAAPRCEYESIPEVFAASLKQEMHVTESIDRLYALAQKEGAHAALVELQWFVNEQVEEEKTVRTISAKFHMVQDDPAAMLDLDSELASRKAEADPAEA